MKTYQSMWRLIRYRPGLYALNCLFWVLIHVSPLVPGLVIREFFDTLNGQGRLDWGVGALVALLVATAFVRIGLIFGGGTTDPWHRFTMSALLRRNLLARILERPGARALPDTTGEALSRFRDDATQAEDAISWTLDVTGTALFALCAIIVLLTIDAKITVFVFLPLVGVVVAARMANRWIERVRRASRAATGSVTGAIGEMFDGVQAIKVAGAERLVLERFRGLNERRRKLMLRDRALTKTIDAVFGNIVSLGTGLLLLVAAGAMRDESFSVGDFALFVSYLGFVTEFTEFFGVFLAHYQQTGVAFERMHGLMQGAPHERLVEHAPLHLGEAWPEPAPPVRAAGDRLERLSVAGLAYRHGESAAGVSGVSF
ncbi:MAG TPA: ABC transporter ATP-binding protein, partial [Herpetosiphonaceae bacterium]